MSAFVTVNGFAAMDAVITVPRVGAWHCDYMLDAGAPTTTGAVSVNIADGALSLQGNAYRVGVFADLVRMRVEGGNGTLRKSQVPPRSYLNVPLSIPLQDLVIKACQEQISSACDSSVLSTFLPQWSFFGVKGGGGHLASLLKAVPADPQGRQLAWRLWRLPVAPGNVLSPGTVPVFDGALWIGYESWPTSPLLENQDYVYAFEDQSVGKFVVEAELPILTPGVVFRGRQITYVRHECTPDQLLRTNAYYEA